MGIRESKISLIAVALEQPQLNPTRREDRRVTVDAIATKLGKGHNVVQEMNGSSGYRKICAHWVPRLLTEDHKVQRKAITSEMRQRYRDEEDDFLLNIATGDKSWFQHFDPATKRQSMEWHHLDSPTKKKPKTMPSAKKIMGTFFWDAEGCILIEFLEPGKTINAARYVQTLLMLRRALRDKQPGRKVILQHDNVRPHTARLTYEKIEKMGWEVLPHTPYSPDLAPSNYHLFGFVKNQMRGQHYEMNKALHTALCQCLWAAGSEFYHKGLFKLPEWWEKCVPRNGDYVEK